jgi:Fe-S cluster assembly protein SufD
MQFHAAPNCRSNLISKNALNDQSKSVFSGMIKVLPSAYNTNAYQTNRNLLLSNEAQADSLPGLEILANEVKCSHGATTSKIDEQELFYLRSRGIPQKSAENLIALGFLEEILAMVKDEELNESIRHKIESRFNNL